MNESAEALIEPKASPGSFEMIRALVGVAALSGFLIVMTYQLTLEPIKKNRAEALRNAVFEVIPGAETIATYRVLEDGTLEKLDGEDEKAKKYYGAYDGGGQLKGVAVEGQGQGYADIIKILYGYDPEAEKVVGMKVLESKETPGLGDKISKDPAFRENLSTLDVRLTPDGKGVQNQVVIVKSGEKTEPWQIEAITGATISSNAIGGIMQTSTAADLPVIRRALDQLKEQR